MQTRVLTPIVLTTTASLVAFWLGMWVAHGGSQAKVGPGGEEQGITHPKSVRVILPGTLDGQSIPGHASGLPDRRRDLSPVYPTSPGNGQDKFFSDVATETAESAQARDEGARPTPPETTALSENPAGPGGRDGEIIGDGEDTRALRDARVRDAQTSYAPWPRRPRATYARRERYFLTHRARPANPLALFARLLSR